MGGSKQTYHNNFLKEDEQQWVIMQGVNSSCDSVSIESSENSTNSAASSSSSDINAENTSSPMSISPRSPGPLYALSELMAELPIKRGLSKYYQGKSQSFASLASVEELEDLAKKSLCRKKMKACKSYALGSRGRRPYTPKPTISKKASRGIHFIFTG